MLPNSLPDVDEESGVLTSPIGLTAGGAGGSGHMTVGSSSPPPLGAVNLLGPVDLDVEPSPMPPTDTNGGATGAGLTVLANGSAERSAAAIATPVIPPRINAFDGVPLGDGVGAGGSNGNGGGVSADVAAAAAAAASIYSPARAATGNSGENSPATGRRRHGSRTSATGAGGAPGLGRRLSRGLSRGQSLIKSKLAESWPYVATGTDARSNLRSGEMR